MTDKKKITLEELLDELEEYSKDIHHWNSPEIEEAKQQILSRFAEKDKMIACLEAERSRLQTVEVEKAKLEKMVELMAKGFTESTVGAIYGTIPEAIKHFEEKADE